MCISAPALVVEVDAERAEALVEIRDALRRISLSVLFLEGVAVQPGDWLLVDAGIALRHIDEEEAKEYRSWLGDTIEMGEMR